MELIKSFYDWGSPMVVDLSREEKPYHLKVCNPKLFSEIDQVVRGRDFQIAYNQSFTEDTRYIPIQGVTWHQSGYGLVSEVSTSQGAWLVKKNLGYYSPPQSAQTRLVKLVDADNWPLWMAPFAEWQTLRAARQRNQPTTVQQMNDVASPLRVVTARKGREAIEADPERFNRLVVPKKYLFPIPDAPRQGPLHERFVVVAEKLNVLSAEETLKKLASLPESDLREVMQQVCRLNRRMLITDLHLGNLVALEGASDQPVRFAFIDTEAIGGLVDISQKDGIQHWTTRRHWDQAVFAILGLRKLEQSTQARINDAFSRSPRFVESTFSPDTREQYKKMHKIMSEEIDRACYQIEQTRKLAYVKLSVTALLLGVGLWRLNRQFHILGQIQTLPSRMAGKGLAAA